MTMSLTLKKILAKPKVQLPQNMYPVVSSLQAHALHAMLAIKSWRLVAAKCRAEPCQFCLDHQRYHYSVSASIVREQWLDVIFISQ
jgi:hypothetical protein